MNEQRTNKPKVKSKESRIKNRRCREKKSIFNNAPPASNSCECKIVFLKFVFIIRQDVTNIFLKIKSSNFGYGRNDNGNKENCLEKNIFFLYVTNQ